MITQNGNGPSILAQREIEARMLKRVHDVLTTRFGAVEADAVLHEVISGAAIAQGEHLASALGKMPDLQDLERVLSLWTREDALAIDTIESTPERLSFNVTRCRYAELYASMGVAQIGHLLSCNRDGDFCIGYNPDITLERTQTIMSGASHCDFRYVMRQPADGGSWS